MSRSPILDIFLTETIVYLNKNYFIMKDIRKKEKDLLFIVDDYPFFGNLTKEILSDIPNVEVMLFESGEDCLDKIHLNPSVVLLDYDLSGGIIKRMNGIDVLREIKRDKVDTRVMMLSGHDNDELRSMSKKKGASDYLVKDFEKLSNIKKRVSNRIRHFNNIKEKRDFNRLKYTIFGVAGVSLIISIMLEFAF